MIKDTITISIEPHSEGGYAIDIYNDVIESASIDPYDGGHYTGKTLKGALKFAISMVEELLKHQK